MRQLIILFGAAAIMSGCNATGGALQGSSELTTQMDSISYSVGHFFAGQVESTGVEVNTEKLGQGVADVTAGEPMLTEEEGIAVMQKFQQALAANQGAPFTDESPAPFSVDTVCYVIGADFARNMAEFDVNLNPSAFYQGAIDFSTDAESIVGDKSDALMQALTAKIQEKQQATQLEESKEHIDAGVAFIAEKAAEEGVSSTATGLHYKVLEAGAGDSPVAADQVTVHYEGRLIDGTVFDSSIERGEPATFPLNGVIAGWTEGLQLMKKGAKYQFYIPHDLAYGLQGAPPSIPAGSTLVFDVELIEIN